MNKDLLLYIVFAGIILLLLWVVVNQVAIAVLY